MEDKRVVIISDPEKHDVPVAEFGADQNHLQNLMDNEQTMRGTRPSNVNRGLPVRTSPLGGAGTKHNAGFGWKKEAIERKAARRPQSVYNFPKDNNPLKMYKRGVRDAFRTFAGHALTLSTVTIYEEEHCLHTDLGDYSVCVWDVKTAVSTQHEAKVTKDMVCLESSSSCSSPCDHFSGRPKSPPQVNEESQHQSERPNAFLTPIKSSEISIIGSTRPISFSPIAPFLELLTENGLCDRILDAIEKASKALHLGKSPELCSEGLSGTYFLRDCDANIVGVFKPGDEEGPLSPKTPRGSIHRSASWRSGVPAGQGFMRERVAYLLDHKQAAGVPPTVMVALSTPMSTLGSALKRRTGSFQLFINETVPSDEYGPSMFPTQRVHFIGLLDIRLMNADRHGGNVVWSPTRHDLVPIDHGLTLPEYPYLNEGDLWFCWMSWPQAKVPFCVETREYIKNIDVEAEIQTIQNEVKLSERSILTLRIGTLLAKRAVAEGLTLFEIGHLVCTTESPNIQSLCNDCEKEHPITSPEFLACFDQALSNVICKK
eukprot:CAMPEP_0184656094 /NCGR_PEP_ID=MMETSP0308-20130426/15557_1 /TAXON_ID=38269 /ORGANISM="Gloeochaete witrockiana, Strain SAG 46.84" /LENGTH=542 /DNA_ID=CAMNT_0027093023 /DNA_START=262 /DNA_END=1890 /DNA_ORIENTATION=-